MIHQKRCFFFLHLLSIVCFHAFTFSMDYLSVSKMTPTEFMSYILGIKILNIDIYIKRKGIHFMKMHLYEGMHRIRQIPSNQSNLHIQ